MAAYYLSDPAHTTIKNYARRDNLTISRWIEVNAPRLVKGKVVIKDSGLIELIDARKIDPRNLTTVERNDKRPPRFKAPPMHDGVVWNAMFGSWGRRARELDLSVKTIELLSRWIEKENVVRRRAASRPTMAGQALELIGRDWLE